MSSFFEQYLYPINNFLNSEYYREFIRLYFKYRNFPRSVKAKIRFLSYNFEVVDMMSFIFQYKHIFVNKMYDFKADNKQPIIYDCGANIGVSALYYKILYPGSVIKAFEADSNIAGILKSNLAVNNIQGVEVINKAAWIDNNGVTFNVDNADGGSVYGEGDKITVDSARLRDLIASEEYIDLIKMNIEGSELDVIPDCEDVLYKAKNLYIEYHSFTKLEQKLDNILHTLKKNGFRYYIQNIVSPKLIPSKESLMSESIDLQLHIFAYKS